MGSLSAECHPKGYLFGQQGDAVAYLVYHLPQLFDPFKKNFQLGFFCKKKKQLLYLSKMIFSYPRIWG